MLACKIMHSGKYLALYIYPSQHIEEGFSKHPLNLFGQYHNPDNEHSSPRERELVRLPTFYFAVCSKKKSIMKLNLSTL
jgi:hypothetical protein